MIPLFHHCLVLGRALTPAQLILALCQCHLATSVLSTKVSLSAPPTLPFLAFAHITSSIYPWRSLQRRRISERYFHTAPIEMRRAAVYRIEIATYRDFSPRKTFEPCRSLCIPPSSGHCAFRPAARPLISSVPRCTITLSNLESRIFDPATQYQTAVYNVILIEGHDTGKNPPS
ncbi:hypothetical protein B0H11DRAFT_1061937 [Mycena galericulata]|nr:hypothetical protein B0H11DRAFT_1061937 [Mycena galericulata]